MAEQGYPGPRKHGWLLVLCLALVAGALLAACTWLQPTGTPVTIPEVSPSLPGAALPATVEAALPAPPPTQERVLPTPVPRLASALVREGQWLELARAFEVERAQAEIARLCQAEFGGRLAGSEGGRRAAEYLAGRFAALGLVPAGEEGTYWQEFTVPLVEQSDVPALTITTAGGEELSVQSSRDFVPIAGDYVGGGTGEGPAIWVNRGAHRDYDGIDATGAIAVCRHPAAEDAFRQAVEHGVAGLLIVQEEAAYLEMGRAAGDTSWISQTIPAAYITPDVAELLLSGTDLTLDDLSIQYRPLRLGTRARLAVGMHEDEKATGRNVLGMLPGRNPSRRDEIVVLGAHYDHLGQRPDGTVFSGANDDASGVAVLLEIARSWQEAGFIPERTVLFAAWDAEEKGLCGSGHYVAHPSLPLTRTVAMLQLDMVGAGHEPILEIDGDGLVRDQALVSAAELGILARPAEIGRSDHVPFREKGIPAWLFIWAGLEGEGSTYHRPSDVPASIEPEYLRQAGQLAELVALHLSTTHPILAQAVDEQQEALRGGDVEAYLSSVAIRARARERERLAGWWATEPHEVNLSMGSPVVSSDVATATLRLSYASGTEGAKRQADYPARFVREGSEWRYAGLATKKQAGAWVQLLTPPGVEDDTAAGWLEQADSLYGQLEEALRLTSGPPVTLEVCEGSSAFGALLNDRDAVRAGYALLGGDALLASPEAITRTLVGVALERAGLPPGKLSWLPAGLSSVLGERSPRQVAAGDVPSQDGDYLAEQAGASWALAGLPELDTVTEGQIGVWQSQARSLAIHLLGERGWPAIAALARAGADAPTLEAACQEALGYPLSELEANWRAGTIERWIGVQRAISDTLRQRSEAVALGDVDAFLSTVNPEQPTLAAEQRHWFEDVWARGVAAYSEAGALEEMAEGEALVLLTQELRPREGQPVRQLGQRVRFVLREGRWLYDGLPFERRSSSHIRLEYVPQSRLSEESLDQLLAEAERAWATVRVCWPSTPEEVIVKHYPSGDSFQWSISAWMPQGHVSWTQPGAAIKLNGSRLADPGYAIAGELAWQALYGLGVGDAWLYEGVAAVTQEMYDRQAFGAGLLSRRRQLSKALRAHEAFDLGTMTGWPEVDDEREAPFETQAWDTVSYLIREHGLVAVRQALEMRGLGRTLDESFFEATGQRWSALVSGWRESALADHFDAETRAFAGRFDGQRALQTARYLSGPQFAGRAPGTEGGEAAAHFIAERFETLGLAPAGDAGGYYQRFPITGTRLISTPVLSFAHPDGRRIQSLGYRQDFRELVRGRAGGGTAEGEVVWVRQEDLGDARLGGRIVLQRVHGDLAETVERAWRAGAGGVILVLDRQTDLRLRSTFLPSLEAETLPVVQITNEAFVGLIKASGHQMVELHTDVPVLRLGFNAHLSVPLEVAQEQPVANVLGLLPGSDEQLKHELLIVGAHYDHVGSLPDGTIYPGANDNASGVGVLLELARLFQTSGWQPRRSILFAAWGAEEMGLVGSSFYVEHPWAPLSRTVAMVQLDMVGQGSGYYLNMHADAGTAGELLATLSLAAEQIDVRASAMGPVTASDHAPFQERGVPAALLIWRGGQEAHLPTDTADLLDPHKLEAAGKVAAAALRRLADWAYVEERTPAVVVDGVLSWPTLTPTVLPAPG